MEIRRQHPDNFERHPFDQAFSIEPLCRERERERERERGRFWAFNFSSCQLGNSKLGLTCDHWPLKRVMPLNFSPTIFLYSISRSVRPFRYWFKGYSNKSFRGRSSKELGVMFVRRCGSRQSRGALIYQKVKHSNIFGAGKLFASNARLQNVSLSETLSLEDV